MGADAQHLKLTVSAGRAYWDVIAFRHGHWAAEMPAQVDLLYNFERNVYNGSVTLQLNVRDLKPAALINETVFAQRPDRDKSVSHLNFLAFRIFARIKADRHLVNPHLAFEQFGGKFRLELKAARMERHIQRDFALKQFITGFHVGQDIVIQNIGHEREDLIRHHIPE